MLPKYYIKTPVCLKINIFFIFSFRNYSIPFTFIKNLKISCKDSNWINNIFMENIIINILNCLCFQLATCMLGKVILVGEACILFQLNAEQTQSSKGVGACECFCSFIWTKWWKKKGKLGIDSICDRRHK